MIRTQVQLREEQMETLRQWASDRRVSIAELIRQAVDMLIRSSASIDEEERRQRAIAMVGQFRSGLSDVSSEHDRYLVEAYEVYKR
jgi:Arc/MetJ-type ribon-helix-helix transcriptional regulator